MKEELSTKLHIGEAVDGSYPEEFKHEFKVLTTEEVMEGRSSAYEFIDFDKQETVEEYFLDNIKNMLQFNNDALAIRFMEKYYQAKKEQEQHDFLPGFIKQFDPKEGEINGEEWTAVYFLKWLELNKFKIVKDGKQ